MVAVLPVVGLSADGYSIRTFAGSNFNGDGGAATAALIGEASGLAADVQGNLYVADALDHRVRKITPDGIILNYAGTGVSGFSGDSGPAVKAQLSYPYGVAVDSRGDLYIADLGNARVRRVTPTGIITTFAGGGSLAVDGILATDSTLSAPRNVAVSSENTLYISDFSANRVVSVSVDGVLHYAAGTGIAGYSGDNGSPTSAQLRNPAGLAFDRFGWLYIADSGNKRIRRVANGRIASFAASDTNLTLYTPTDVAVDSAGNVYIADGRIDETVRLSSIGAVISIHAGSRSLTIGHLQELYLGLGTVVRRYSAGAISVAAGTGYFTFGGDDGPAAGARLSQPAGIAVDAAGVTYIADTANHRIRSVGLDGSIRTIAGIGTPGFSGDGLPATSARIDSPGSVAVDGANNLYVLDNGNHRIRKITPGGIISTVAGTGLRGYSGDNGPALFAEFDSPSAIATDSAGDLYVADSGNHRIRRIDTAGFITTIAGNGLDGDAGDGGQAIDAALNSPGGIAVDDAGNVYIADTGNQRIRRLNASGAIEAWGSSDWAIPTGLAVSSDGSLLVADSGLERIRRVAASGTTGTVAGNGQTGFSGDDGPALESRLNGPSSIAISPAGDILFTDTENSRVRILSPGAVASPVKDGTGSISVLNAASLTDGPVAPGELVQLTAAGLSNDPAVSLDGHPAPVLTRDREKLTVQIPYELAGSSSALLRLSLGSGESLEQIVTVAPAAPGVYTDGGKNQVNAFNEDGELNGLLHPAPRGSTITLFCTGEGQTNPAGITGLAVEAPAPEPVLEVQAEIAGAPAEVLESSEAIGLAGVLQLRVRVPGGFLPSGVVPFTITIGGRASQPGVTLVIE